MAKCNIKQNMQFIIIISGKTTIPAINYIKKTLFICSKLELLNN